MRALSEHGADALALPVGQVMTRDVATCGGGRFGRQHHGAHDGRKIPSPAGHRPMGSWSGFISIGDVVKHRVEEIESESEAMRDYIQTA